MLIVSLRCIKLNLQSQFHANAHAKIKLALIVAAAAAAVIDDDDDKAALQPKNGDGGGGARDADRKMRAANFLMRASAVFDESRVAVTDADG